MESSLEREIRSFLGATTINSVRTNSAPSTPSWMSKPTSMFDPPKPSSCPRHIETDLERTYRQCCEKKSIERMSEIRDELKKRSAALSESISPSSPTLLADVKHCVREPPSPMRLLLNILAVFCFAFFMGVVGHFKDEVPLVGRFIVDVVAAVLSTLWDIGSFPFEFWANPREKCVCMAFKATEALVYSCVFSTSANVLLFDNMYNIFTYQMARIESRYHARGQIEAAVESFCFNVKTAVDGYREAYGKMVPLLQHDPTVGADSPDGACTRLEEGN